MALRFFIVPELITQDDKGRNLRRPSYVVESGCTNWGALDYGIEPIFLLGADVTAGQLASISAGVNTITIPANIDVIPVGAALTQTKSALETLNIPAGNWVDALTYRELIRLVAKIFLFMQRWRGLGGGNIYGSGVTLDTTLASLPQVAKIRLQAVANSFGYDSSQVTVSTTIRDALYFLGKQWVNDQIILHTGIIL